MNFRFSCPNCRARIPGRPLFAFKRPPAELACPECRSTLKAPFTYRLAWCFGMCTTVFWLPFAVWLALGDHGMLAGTHTLQDIGIAVLVTALYAYIPAMGVALLLLFPLTLVLRPRSPAAPR